MILLAIGFFIYRGISPSWADTLLLNIRNIPVRLWILSWELQKSAPIFSGKVVPISSWSIVSSHKPLVFTSTLVSGWTFSLAALQFPHHKILSFTSTLISGWFFTSDAYVFSEQEAVVFTSALISGWLFSLDALVIPIQNTTILDDTSAIGETWGSLTILSDTGTTSFVEVEQQPVIPMVTPSKVKPVSHSKTPTPSLNQDITLLNNLFK